MIDTAPHDGPDRAPSLAGEAWLQRNSTQAVLAAIEDAGYGARVVGGAVRNALLGRVVRDIDVATPASPDRVVEIVERAGLKAVPTGIAHGTITVVADGEPVEVTTLREDVETFGRHAEVRFTTEWEADAGRRDFTINALYCNADGTVFDPLGGYDDLKMRRVRFIGDPAERIREDYLRILRFFRFFAEYGAGEIDPAGLHASVSERTGLRRLSGERLRQELIRLLVAPRALDALQALFDHGLFGEFLPVVPRLNRLARLCAIDDGQSAIVRLGVATLGIDEDVARVADKLRLSNTERKLLKTVAQALQIEPAPNRALAKRWLYAMGPEQYRAQVLVGRSRSYQQMSDPGWIEAFGLPGEWTAPGFPIGGATALALGGQPGPALGQALREVEDIWLDSDFTLNEEELKAILAEKLRNPPGDKV